MSRPVTVERRPTRFSTALVVVLTLLSTWLLADAAGLTRGLGYGGAGAASLAGLLWLLSRDRWRPLGAGIAGGVLPTAGLALLAAAGTTIAAQVDDTVPIGSVFLVVGGTAAVFGALTVAGRVFDREALAACLRAGFRTTVVVGSAVTFAALARFGPLGAEIGDLLWRLADLLVAPNAAVPIGTFLLLVVAAVYGVRAATTELPIAAAADRQLSPGTRSRLTTLDRWLSVTALPVATVTCLLVVLELARSSPYGWLPAAVTGPLGVVLGVEPLRWLLGLVAVGSTLAFAFARTIRSTYQRSARETLTVLAAYGSGLILTLTVLWYHEPFLSALTGRVERRLPARLVVPFRDLWMDALSVYGEELLALVVVTVLLVVSLSVLAVAFLAVVLGTLDDRAAGASLAAAGLFVAATFGAVLGIRLPIVLSGALASLLVWDVGSFGATLGHELGTRTATLRTELAHGGATLVVGVGALVVALGLGSAAKTVPVAGDAGVVALVGAVVGALLLIVASR